MNRALKVLTFWIGKHVFDENKKYNIWKLFYLIIIIKALPLLSKNIIKTSKRF